MHNLEQLRNITKYLNELLDLPNEEKQKIKETIEETNRSLKDIKKESEKANGRRKKNSSGRSSGNMGAVPIDGVEPS